MIPTTATLKLFFALSALTMILVAGYFPFKKRLAQAEQEHTDFPLGETLGTGVFLGAALLHMLPEAQTLFMKQGYHYPFALLISGIVFLLFLWFEHLGKELYHHHHNHTTHPAFAIVAWIMLSIHSFVLGTALGLSQDYSMQIMLFLAIIAHKWAESFAIAVQLNKSTLSPSIAITLFLSFAMMTPLGIGIGWYVGRDVSTHSFIDPLLMAISAGTFLYLGTLHGLERCVMVKRCCNLRDFSFVIVGFLLMAAVAAYV
ncbi:MAG: ZIP family metal transporter [Legionella sp.]|jgi:zinc transporter ZupT|nr:ZIP family metal transporter [Legionella sp.]